MRKILTSIVLGVFLILFSVDVIVSAQDMTPVFHTQQVVSGVISVSYNAVTEKKVKVAVEKNGKKIYYNLKSDGAAESFPLQLGNGDYKVTVYENITGEQYRYVSSTNVSLALSNDNVLYLNSIQNINWNGNMSAVEKAKELTKSLTTDSEKINAIYRYIVANIRYDYSKLKGLSTTYVPDIDETYTSNTGICYDYASLFAAMLRSVGVPAKLVKGYTDNAAGYHAWNEVYDSAAGKWLLIDTTYDSQIKASKGSYSMIKTSGNYREVYEY